MTITNKKGVVVGQNGAAPVNIDVIKGVVSTVNSSVTNIGSNLSFTGEWEEIKDCAIIKVGVYSDQDSAVGGVCFQQSPDQVEVFDEPYSLSAGDQKLWTPNPVLRYFRIVYNNGPVTTTSFGIQTIYSSVYAKPTSHRLGDTVTDEDDTELVKAVISYRDENDQEYNNVGIQNPFPVDGDSVYAKDIWSDQSDTGDFSGSVTDLFDNLHTVIINTTATNPKEILIHFNRTIVGNVFGLGAFSGDFSNTEIQIGNSGGIFTTVIGESASATKYTSRTFQLPVTAGYNAVKLIFHTADTVTLSNAVILKTRSVVARMQATSELNGEVEDISSYRGTLNVNNAWVHRKIVNETVHQHTGTTTTPSVAVTAEDTSITFTSVVGFAIGGMIKLTEGSLQEIGILTITNIVGVVVDLDRPIGNDYTTAAVVEDVIVNMAVLGTLASPVIFEIDPPVGVVWQLTRLLLSITDNLVMDDAKFGGILALTNGVALRATTAAGRTVVFANWKSNADMKLDMFNVDYSTKAPAGSYGLSGRWTLTTAEIVSELDGDASPVQKVEALIQDDLTGLTTFYMKGQGRVFSP